MPIVLLIFEYGLFECKLYKKHITKEMLMICQLIKNSLMLVSIAIASIFLSACSSVKTTSETPSISDIQGSGTKSPLEGQIVSISAIVTGDFQNNDADATSNLGGFYIQGPLS